MTSVITGDIIQSKKVNPEVWLSVLKTELLKIGANPTYWEIYRGDSFQIIVSNPLEALPEAIKLKASLRMAKVDARMAIGIGDISFQSTTILESNGSAFVRSGEKFETLNKERQTLAVKSPWSGFDEEVNLLLKLGLLTMNSWSENSAQIVKIALENPTLSQEELGGLIGLKQNAVSNRMKRANFEEMIALIERYKLQLNKLL